jgi:uncharacterized membrane protein YhaH (DUF805 family)
MPAIDLAKRAKFAIVNHYQVTFLVLPTIFFALATVTVGLRLHVRRMKNAKFTPDDYLCAFSLVSFNGNPILRMCSPAITAARLCHDRSHLLLGL